MGLHYHGLYPHHQRGHRPEKTGIEEEEKYWILRKFVVFNAEQVEGAAAREYQDVEIPDTKTDFKPDFEPAEELVQATGAEIFFGGDRAFYQSPSPEGSFGRIIPSGDFIQVPHKSCFVEGGYYPTLSTNLPIGARSGSDGSEAKRIIRWAN